MNRPSAVLGIVLALAVALLTGSVLLVAYGTAVGSMLLVAGVLFKKAFRRYRDTVNAQSNVAAQSGAAELDGDLA